MTDTIVAQATAAGEAAISVVRLSGPKALQAAAAFLRGGVPLQTAEARRLVRMKAVDTASGAGEFLDEVVAAVYRAPQSYTGEDMVEIFAHGSPYVVERLLSSAARAGARPAGPGEFTLRAFLNGKLDLAQAEGVAATIRARTRQAHRAAAHQLSGGLSRALEVLRQSVVGLLALYEAQLDHADEGIEVLNRRETAAAFDTLEASLRGQLNGARSARFAAEGARVAIVGAPNAGKSSLLNALLGRERAIVLDEPGTTRDVLEERAELDGLPVVLLDTAGLRGQADDAAERLGMERTREALSRADVVLCVFDGSRERGEAERAVLAELARESAASPGRGMIAVLNKSDLERAAGPEPSGFDDVVSVSALKKTGLETLSRAVARRAGTTGEEGIAAANARQQDALGRAHAAVNAAKTLAAAADVQEELVAARLREALSALGEIAGQTCSEEILAAVFSRFCIGK